MSKFYVFNQNNTGGNFVFTPNALSHWVIIEAMSADAANAKLEQLGGYFDGCDDGLDCSCCGDRWYRCDENDGENEPMIYNEIHWMGENPEAFIHYLDGSVVPVYNTKEGV